MGIIIPREWISTQAATTYGVFDGINNYPAERLIYGLREVPFYKACPSLGAQFRAAQSAETCRLTFRKKEKEILDSHPDSKLFNIEDSGTWRLWLWEGVA